MEEMLTIIFRREKGKRLSSILLGRLPLSSDDRPIHSLIGVDAPSLSLSSVDRQGLKDGFGQWLETPSRFVTMVI